MQRKTEYENYQRQIRADRITRNRARHFYNCLHTKGERRLNLNTLKPYELNREAYNNERDNLKTELEIIHGSKMALRTQTLIYAEASKAVIERHLKRVKRIYFRKLRRNLSKPLITYTAETEESLNEEHLSYAHNLILRDKKDPSIVYIPDEDWIKSLKKFENALESQKSMSIRLSDRITSWEKYIDDKWKLNVSYIAIALSVALFLINQVIIFKNNQNRDHNIFELHVMD